MKKASSSFLILCLMLLICSLTAQAQVYQDQNRISERVQQTLRMYERMRLSEILRLSYQDQTNIEILSLSVEAQSYQGQGQLSLSQSGRVLSNQIAQRQLRELRFVLPPRVIPSELELSASSEVYIESVTAEIRYIRSPMPQPVPVPQYPQYPQHPQQPQQPLPQSMLTLRLNQTVYGYSQISLHELVRSQLGITLEGAQIERVIVQGESLYGRSASVQVELNQRPVGQAKYLNPSQRQTPFPLQSMEEVRALSLVVNGDAIIREVLIRVGQVRPRYQEAPRSQRLSVNREVHSRMALELSSLLPYEQRLVTSISVESRSLYSAQAVLSLVSGVGSFEGQLYVGSYSQRQVIRLRRPMSLRELRFQSATQAFVEAIELEFEQYPRY